ncbi:MAG: hypothetical protein RLZZ200_1634 [Pseudomonadota bacterium]
MAAANAAYAASGVNITMNLVHMAQVSYTESGDMGVSLDRVTSATDGYMDDVHTLRNQYGADLVGLITNETNYCGIAWVNSSASYAFSVTYWGCFAGQTFAHEVGHNQGNLHDRPDGGSGGAYPYSYGFRTCDYPALSNGHAFRTVMAYSCTGVPRVNYFSNPNLLYNGAPMGIAYETDPANSADNVRSMNNTSAAKAAFRTSNATLPATPGNLAGTAITPDQINLTWTDNATDETAYSVERATGSGTYSVVATLGANAASYGNTGLAGATTYSYRVRAYNGSGYSQYSNVVTLTTPPAVPTAVPDAPGSPTVSLAGRTATLRWTDVATETSYDLRREQLSTKGTTWTATTLSLAANVTSRSENLSKGRTYRYAVRATNAGGGSVFVPVSCAGIAGCTNTSQFKVP